MSDLLFVIRTFFVTLIVVLVLQVKIGDFTLEERSMTWVRSSSMVGYLQGVADGAVVLMERGIVKIKSLVSAKASKEMKESEVPGFRSLVDVERSKEYLVEKAQRAKEIVSDTVNKAVDSVQEKTQDDGIEDELSEAMDLDEVE